MTSGQEQRKTNHIARPRHGTHPRWNHANSAIPRPRLHRLHHNPTRHTDPTVRRNFPSPVCLDAPRPTPPRQPHQSLLGVAITPRRVCERRPREPILRQRRALATNRRGTFWPQPSPRKRITMHEAPRISHPVRAVTFTALRTRRKRSRAIRNQSTPLHQPDRVIHNDRQTDNRHDATPHMLCSKVPHEPLISQTQSSY